MNVNPIQKLLIPLFRVYFIGVPNSYELVQDGLCIQNMVILQKNIVDILTYHGGHEIAMNNSHQERHIVIIVHHYVLVFAIII